MFDINLEKEMAAAKQQAALTVLNQKFESSKVQGEIMQQDIDTKEK